MQLLLQKDLAIKKNTLESLSMIVYNNHLNVLVADKLEDLVKVTLAETPIKKELITQVDLGPFKYNQDNGAVIRKAAFSLLENITEKFSYN
jgi:cullin-associated NEDD8-dissociated protein 1